MLADTTTPKRPRYGHFVVERDGGLTDVPARVARPRSAPRGHLARPLDYDPTLVTFPVAGQPKLDGVRATLSRRGLHTRDGLAIRSTPEIAALAERVPDGVTIDGEMWGRGLTLEEISAALRSATPSRISMCIDFWAFDLFGDDGRGGLHNDTPFRARWAALDALVGGFKRDGRRIHTVDTTTIRDQIGLEVHYAACLEAGAEGQIIRDPRAAYIPGRSAAVMRRKPFRDAEATLVALVAGRKTGLMRTAIARDVETGEKLTIAIQAMSDDERLALAANPPEAGRLLTYRWQDTASTHKRHCTLVRIHGPEGRL